MKTGSNQCVIEGFELFVTMTEGHPPDNADSVQFLLQELETAV